MVLHHCEKDVPQVGTGVKWTDERGSQMRFSRETELKRFLAEKNRMVFYGTGGMGKNLYFYLLENGWQEKLAFFLVTRKDRDYFWGIPVRGIGELGDEEKGLPVIIATRRNFHREIQATLQEAGVREVHTVSEELLNQAERISNRTYLYPTKERTARYGAWKAQGRHAGELWNKVCDEL